jgi:hypothetical protein
VQSHTVRQKTIRHTFFGVINFEFATIRQRALELRSHSPKAFSKALKTATLFELGAAQQHKYRFLQAPNIPNNFKVNLRLAADLIGFLIEEPGLQRWLNG